MSKKNNKKRNIIIVSIVVIGIIALIVAKKQGLLGTEEYQKVSTQEIEVGSIIESITASGKIQPEREILIAPDASGEIKGIFVKEGDSVKEGQLLLKINPDIYLSTMDKVRANLNSSKANLANSKARYSQSKSQLLKAENSFKRQKKLHDKEVISDSDFEAAESTYEVAKADVEASKQSVESSRFQVKNAEAALREAQDNLTKTAVYSPLDGTVSKLSKEVGERVSGASQFSAGSEVMRIANLNHMEAQVDVSENDIIRVSLNDTALIEVDAYLGRKFKGLVSEIANSAKLSGQGTDQVTNFVVKIRILSSSYDDLLDTKNPNLSPFRPGMSASVEILTTYENNIVTVPIQAVTTRNDTSSWSKNGNNYANKKIKKVDNGKKKVELEDETKTYVFVYSDSKVKLREIKIGIQDTEFYQVKSGLEKGEEVVVAPYRAISKKLKNNQPVNKVDKSELFQ